MIWAGLTDPIQAGLGLHRPLWDFAGNAWNAVIVSIFVFSVTFPGKAFPGVILCAGVVNGERAAFFFSSITFANTTCGDGLSRNVLTRRPAMVGLARLAGFSLANT